MKKFAFIFAIYLLSSINLFAGGFQVNLQGQKEAGMGHTGTGLVLDNSTVFFNPGGMSFLDSLKGVSFGFNLIFPRTTFLETSPGTYTSNIEPHVATPINLYSVFQFKKLKKLSAGIGIYNPFGSLLQWPNDWKGQFLIQKVDLKTFFIQPTLSYKLNEKWGVGLGFVFATGNFTLQQSIPIQNTSGNYGQGNLSGNANGYGFNGGIFYKATKKLSIGFDYRSQVNVKVAKGSANFTVPSSVAEYFPTTTFSTQLKLPQVATIGIGYAITNKISLALDINYVGWKSYDSLNIDFAQHTENLKDLHSPKMYQNVFIYRIGGQYLLSNKWTVRLGAYYDMSPIPNGYFSPETPDENKIGITSGASYRITKKIHMDLSLLYIEGLKRTDYNPLTNFGGTFKEKAVIPGGSIEYTF